MGSKLISRFFIQLGGKSPSFTSSSLLNTVNPCLMSVTQNEKTLIRLGNPGSRGQCSSTSIIVFVGSLNRWSINLSSLRISDRCLSALLINISFQFSAADARDLLNQVCFAVVLN